MLLDHCVDQAAHIALVLSHLQPILGRLVPNWGLSSLLDQTRDLSLVVSTWRDFAQKSGEVSEVLVAGPNDVPFHILKTENM